MGWVRWWVDGWMMDRLLGCLVELVTWFGLLVGCLID